MSAALRDAVAALAAVTADDGILAGTGRFWIDEPRRPAPPDYDLILPRYRAAHWAGRLSQNRWSITRWGMPVPPGADHAGYFYLRAVSPFGVHVDLGFAEEVGWPRRERGPLGWAVPRHDIVCRKRALGRPRDVQWLKAFV